jgi:hypothetical protein
LLLELLDGDAELHDLLGLSDVAVVDGLESVVDAAGHSSLALNVPVEGGPSEEPVQEILSHADLGDVAGVVGQGSVYLVALGVHAAVLGLHDVVREAGVGHLRHVHHGLQTHLLQVADREASLQKGLVYMVSYVSEGDGGGEEDGESKELVHFNFIYYK